MTWRVVREEDAELGGDAPFYPIGGISRRRKQQPTLVFLPGESQGQRSLAGYSPWVCKESDRIEVTKHTHTVREDPGERILQHSTLVPIQKASIPMKIIESEEKILHK